MRSKIGTEMKVARVRQNSMTQAELAEKTGIHPMTIYRMESGEYTKHFRAVQLVALAEAFGLPFEDLVSWCVHDIRAELAAAPAAP